MKKNIIISIIAFLLPAAMAIAAQLPDFPFLYAVGTATKEIPPDLATITFHVEAFDENPVKAFDIVQNRSIELIDLFKKLEIPTKDIETYEIDKRTVRQEKDYVELKILGYEVEQKFSIKLRGLTQYATLMEKLLKFRNISNIDAQFDVSQRKEIEASLMADACANAKVQAENMANGIGAKLGSVFAISDQGLNEMEGQFGMSSPSELKGIMFKKSMMGGDTGKVTFIPSTIGIGKKVNVVFKLETK